MKIECTWTSDRTAFIKIELTRYKVPGSKYIHYACDTNAVKKQLDKIIYGLGFTRIAYWSYTVGLKIDRMQFKEFRTSVIKDDYIDDRIP